MTDRSTDGCWVKRMMSSEIGEAELNGLPHYPIMAISPKVLHYAVAVILEGWRVRIQLPAFSLSVSKGSVSHIVHDFGYLQLFTGWVSWSLTAEYKTQRNASSSVFLSRVEAEGGASLSLIVTVGETLADHFEPETKRPSMEWYHTQSLGGEVTKSFQQQAVSWLLSSGTEEAILVDMLLREEMINSIPYIRTLKELNISSEFGLTRIRQKFRSSLTMQSHTQVWRLSHHQIWLDSVTQSTQQPQSSTLRFPPVWSTEGCYLYFEVWD